MFNLVFLLLIFHINFIFRAFDSGKHFSFLVDYHYLLNSNFSWDILIYSMRFVLTCLRLILASQQSLGLVVVTEPTRPETGASSTQMVVLAEATKSLSRSLQSDNSICYETSKVAHSKMADNAGEKIN